MLNETEPLPGDGGERLGAAGVGGGDAFQADRGGGSYPLERVEMEGSPRPAGETASGADAGAPIPPGPGGLPQIARGFPYQSDFATLVFLCAVIEKEINPRRWSRSDGR